MMSLMFHARQADQVLSDGKTGRHENAPSMIEHRPPHRRSGTKLTDPQEPMVVDSQLLAGQHHRGRRRLFDDHWSAGDKLRRQTRALKDGGCVLVTNAPDMQEST
jgi:hypothetical protein